MAKSQEKATIIDNKKQDLNEIVDKMHDDASDQPKPKNKSHDDHVSLVKTAENDKTSELKIMTRYLEVLQERMVKYLRGENIIMDMQLASGAMIQITRPWDEKAKAEYRPVRVIGMVENVDKAEKLIKALLAFVDAGGSSLLFKGYGTRKRKRKDSFRHGQRSDHFSDRHYGRKRSRSPLRRFKNGQNGSRFCMRSYGQRHSRWPIRRGWGSPPSCVRYSSSCSDASNNDSCSRYSSSCSDASNNDSCSSWYDSDHSYKRRRSPSPSDDSYRRRHSSSPKRPCCCRLSSCSSSPSPKRPFRSLSRSFYPSPKRPPFRSFSPSPKRPPFRSFSPSPKRSPFRSFSPSPKRPPFHSFSPSPKRPYGWRRR